MKGHIYKRGKTYTYVIDLGKDPITNKRQQKTKGGFKTKKEAEAALAKIQTEYNEGTYINQSEITFKEFVNKWMELYKKTGVKENTVLKRVHETGVMLDYFKEAKLQNISTPIYQDFLLSLSDQFAESTIRKINITGRMVFRKAIELKYIRENPTEYVVIPKKPKTLEESMQEDVPKYFEKDELQEFLECAKKDINVQSYYIYLTLAYTGMRIGELCALQWKDIDFDNKTINIYKNYFNAKNKVTEYKLTTTKSESSKRIIVIDDFLVAALKKHRAWQSQLILLTGDTWHKKDFVFTKYLRYAGYPETPNQIEKKMDLIIEKNNIKKKLTPHNLRHTHTSLLAEAGVSLEEIMERLGHKNDTVTRNIYLHITKDMKKDASQKFAELMKSI